MPSENEVISCFPVQRGARRIDADNGIPKSHPPAMLEITETDLVFSFPEVDEEAILRVHFCPADSPAQRIRIKTARGTPARVATEGCFVMHLQPNAANCGVKYRPLRYPFALLLSVNGKNAIT